MVGTSLDVQPECQFCALGKVMWHFNVFKW